MRFKNNPFMTLNHGMLGIPLEFDYTVEIGNYDVGSYETDHRWYDKCKNPPLWTKDLKLNEAKHMYEIILMALTNEKYRKGTKLMKRVHSKTFIDGETNYIVYSYRQGYMTKRFYIQFNPISQDDKYEDLNVVEILPKVDMNIVRELIK